MLGKEEAEKRRERAERFQIKESSNPIDNYKPDAGG